MLKLADTFNAMDARVDGTFMFVDMFDSAGYKANGEAAWITTMAWLYDTVGDVVAAGDAGTIVKYLGDGVMIAYEADGATAAINDAIRLQEALEDGVEGQQVRVSCSIGIATGKGVIRFEIAPGHYDYLGPVVDRAARLCGVASPQAIFADADTIDSAQMNKAVSRIGTALRRMPSEYKGEVQKANLKGFAAPVEYYELLWAQAPFGLKSRVVTDSIEASPAARDDRAASVSTMPRPARGERGRRGVVSSWNEEGGWGFIDDGEGERFFTNRRFLVVADDLEASDVVYFVARPAPAEDKLRVAAAVLAVDQDAEGRVVAVRDGFGFVQVADPRGNEQDVFVSAADCEVPLERFGRVEFVVAESHRGVRAEEVRPAQGPSSRAA